MGTIIDRLKKISEIAAKNASESLSKMVDREIEVKSLDIKIKETEKINQVIDLEEMVGSVYLPFKGGVRGDVLFALPKETALIMSDLLLKREADTTRKLTKLDESALKEVGNIVVGSYFTVLSNTLQVEMIAQVPNFSFDMFGAIIEQIASNFAKKAKEVLIIDVEFIMKPLKLNGYLLFFFKTEEIEAIIDALERGK